MEIGKVIRDYRKKKQLTQEQMANRLGVTAPAVNKWEKQHSLPDITLLSPIARLLDISLDTLLSFHETLSDEEFDQLTIQLDEKLKSASFDVAFNYAKNKIETYPNCYLLLWQMALLLDNWQLSQACSRQEKKENFIQDCYLRVLASEEEAFRIKAADALYHFHLRKKEYTKAESFLAYYSDQNPLKAERQAYLYSQTNRLTEAYHTYEQLLLSTYQTMNQLLNGLTSLAHKEQNTHQLELFIEKQCQLAALLEIGDYQTIAPKLELAILKQDVSLTISTMKKMLASVALMTDFRKSALYQHLDFNEPNAALIEQQKVALLTLFKDEETFSYLQDNPQWHQLIQEQI